MKPSIGRNVHYYLVEGERPHHANIVDVTPKDLNTHELLAEGRLEENCFSVNLTVFAHDGHVFTSGVLNAPYSPTPLAGHWTWPPRV